MPISSTDVVTLVKTRLHLTDTSQDALVESYVAEIEQRILNYCNVDLVPNGLLWTWASMAIDALRVEQTSVEAIGDTADRGESVRLGDTSVAPAGSGDAVTNVNKKVIDAVVLNYRVDLNRYRKLRWLG